MVDRPADGWVRPAMYAGTAGASDVSRRLLPLQGVIFDWGGTLSLRCPVDPTEVWRPAAAVIDPARGEEVAAVLCEEERAFWARVTGSTAIGGDLRDIVGAAIDRLGLRLSAETEARAIDAYLDAWDTRVRHHDAAAGTIRALRRMGLRIGLLSNTHWPRRHHTRFLRRDGLLDLFDMLIYSSEQSYAKPHPQVYRAATAALGIDEPGAAVYVGDKPLDDVRGAQEAGLWAVLVGDEDPAADGVVPDAVARSLDDLVTVISGLAAVRPAWARP